MHARHRGHLGLVMVVSLGLGACATPPQQQGDAPITGTLEDPLLMSGSAKGAPVMLGNTVAAIAAATSTPTPADQEAASTRSALAWKPASIQVNLGGTETTRPTLEAPLPDTSPAPVVTSSARIPAATAPVQGASALTVPVEVETRLSAAPAPDLSPLPMPTPADSLPAPATTAPATTAPATTAQAAPVPAPVVPLTPLRPAQPASVATASRGVSQPLPQLPEGMLPTQADPNILLGATRKRAFKMVGYPPVPEE